VTARPAVPATTEEPAAGPREGRAGRPRPDLRGGRSTRARRDARLAYLFVAPTVLVVVGLVLFPLVWNVSLSLRELRLIELRDFELFDPDVTLENYGRVIGSDFWPLLGRTLVYAVGGTTLALLLGLWAALAVRGAFPGRGLVRGLLLFPYVVPVVAAALLWRTMLNPRYGIVNEWLQAVGLGPVDFLLQRPQALVTVIVFEGWRSFPFAFLFIMARLQAMPRELEEAAMVDGASAVQRFRHIVLPQLTGVFAVLFLLRFIWTFNAFDEIYLLTGGAAGTDVISVQIYSWLFGRSDVGAAAALSIVLAATLAVSLAAYFRWFYREESA
jgi:multiple sugar transport system permease protein